MPSTTSTDDTKPRIATASAGVPNRGLIRATAGKKSPSWAIAKYTRGADMISAAMLPSTHTITIAASTTPPAGPKRTSPAWATNVSSEVTRFSGTK